jgi:hypothetical protein
MSNKSPFFYIIKHAPSGSLYAGSKYGADSNPEKFMVQGGYITSSNTVKKLIEKDGLDSFTVELILSEVECGMHVRDFETLFLKRNAIAKDPNWLNSHNNDGFFKFGYGTEGFKQAMMQYYGVENPMHSEQLRNKIKQTCLVKYGTESYSSTNEYKAKYRETCTQRFGGPAPASSEWVKEKMKRTNIQKRGVEYPMQDLRVQEKSRASLMTSHGVSHNSQIDGVKAAKRQKALIKFGVTCTLQSPDVFSRREALRNQRNSREEVALIRKYAKKFNFQLGRGWYQRDDEFIEFMLSEIKDTFGEL